MCGCLHEPEEGVRSRGTGVSHTRTLVLYRNSVCTVPTFTSRLKQLPPRIDWTRTGQSSGLGWGSDLTGLYGTQPSLM